MKLLHIADLHLGAPMSSRLDAERTRVRRRELLRSLYDALDFGVKNGVGAVLIAGDLFDCESVSERVLTHACEVIRSYAPLPIFYVTGNHERSVLLTYKDKPKNLYTFTSAVTGYELGDVCILGTNESAPDMLRSVRVHEGKKNIFLFHGELRHKSDFGGVIGLCDLAHHGIDYLALGHYHTFGVKKIDGGGVAVYAGVPEGRGFDEVGKKGVVLFDTADFQPHFYPIAKRTYHELHVDISQCETTEQIFRAIDETSLNCKHEDLVRLVLTGERDLTLRIDRELVRLRLEERFWYFELVDQTKARDTANVLCYDRSVRGEFIRLVLADEALGDAEKREIIDCGLLALSGEEMSL